MSNEVYKVPQLVRNKPSAKLLYITKAKYEKDWHSTKHTHHFTELLYVLKGAGTVLVSNDAFHVKEHDLIIINPNIEHTEKSAADHPLEYIALGIEGLSFSHPNDSGSSATFYNYKDEREEYLFYLKRLLEEAQNQQENYDLMVQHLLDILLLKMLRKKAFTLEKTSTQKITKDIAYIKKFIKQHFREDINLDTLAEVSHINKYYLAHSFKKVMGISPIEYLIQIRIHESKILLETTNYPISNISTVSGFSSQSFFSQSFKRVTHMTPSQYRKRKTGKNKIKND